MKNLMKSLFNLFRGKKKTVTTTSTTTTVTAPTTTTVTPTPTPTTTVYAAPVVSRTVVVSGTF